MRHVCGICEWPVTIYLPFTMFSLFYRILIQGGKTHPLISIVGTNNFIEYLQSYQILIFIYCKFYFIIFIIIQYTVHVVGTLAAIKTKTRF